jgi:hypothetical protein
MRFTRRGFGVGALGAGAIAAIAPNALAAALPWLRAETPRFIVYSNASEDRVRSVARDLETFDALLGRMTSAGPSQSPLKLEVFLFRSPDLFDEAWGAHTNAIDGFYIPTPELIASFANYRDNQGLLSQVTLFHEYTHHFMFAHFANAYPSWYVEGFADFTSTAQLQDNRIVIGRSISARTDWLIGARQWMPMEELLVAAPSDMKTLEDVARFYAQSWLFTHYISLTPGEVEHFRVYISAFRRGADPVTSFQAAFGESPGEMQTILHAYLRHTPALALNRPAAVEHSEAAVTTMPASADALIALWSRVRRHVSESAGTTLLSTIRDRVGNAPQDQFALMTLARAEATIGDHQRARDLLQPYLAAHPADVEANFLTGLSYFNDAQDVDDEAKQAALTRARHYFVVAYRQDQNYVPALYRYAETFQDQPMTEAAMANTANVALLAHQLAPQVAEIGFLAAQWLMTLDRPSEAVPILRAIAYDPHGGEGAKQARDLLQQAEAAAAQQVAATAHAPGAQH